jgi:acetyl/propionyl-CoA carboxylase alpha subunit
MLTAKVNDTQVFEIDDKNNALTLNGEQVQPDWVKTGERTFHAIINNQSLTLELGSVDETGKQLTVVVNGVKYQVALQNQFDLLLKQLGMDKMASGKVNMIKAPMPGMVLRIDVKAGDTVKKGDALLVLEAMKMENVIKATGDAVVKKVVAVERTAVDKGQVLVEFE